MATTVKNLSAGEQQALETRIAAQEEELKNLTKNIEVGKTSIENLWKDNKEEQNNAIECGVRYQLLAPPNAMYHPAVIEAFLFCPVCVSLGTGEFHSAEAARSHCQYDPFHQRMLDRGSKKFLDRIKCTRCRICGVDCFGGDQVLSHLLSDTHRLNTTGVWDDNNPKILDKALQNVQIATLEGLLTQQLRDRVAIKQAEKVQKALEEKEKDKNKFANTNFSGSGGPPSKKKKKANSGGTNASSAALIPLKLSKGQRKKGPQAIIDLYRSATFDNFCKKELGVDENELLMIKSKFTIPFIYSSLQAGKQCFVCHHEMPVKPGGLSDGDKVQHVSSKLHRDRLVTWVKKVDSLLGINVHSSIKSLIFNYCEQCDVHLQNWNAVIAHLEMTAHTM